MENQRCIKFLRIPEVEARNGYKRNTVYERVADGLLTAPCPLSGQAVGWPEHEIEEINQAILAGKTKDEIRELVVRLETLRTGTPAMPRRKRKRRAAENPTEQIAA